MQDLQHQTTTPQPAVTRSNIPARLDALPWSRWHWRVVLALGITWLLDGLEVTIVGSLGPILQRSGTLGLSDEQIGLTGSAYIAGAVCGALYFGWLSDRLGRRKLFLVTLSVYMVATVLTAFTFNFATFALCRFLAGFGIGGEYAAINSTIDELIPARVRGLVDLAVNGTFWLGAFAGAAMSIFLLNPHLMSVGLGWRLSFALGALLCIPILIMRRTLPESPRWLIAHGQHAKAEAIVAKIEKEIAVKKHTWNLPKSIIPLTSRSPVSWIEILRVIFTQMRSRAMVALSLMVSQAFFYNAIFFTYAMILTKFYGVKATEVGYYIFPFALGNFFGPVLLGKLFDTVGRRKMICITYALSGIGLFAMGYAFSHGMLTLTTQTIFLCVIFFVASAAASSAYLTVSEIFPVEIRAISISLFYAIGTGLGGFIGPIIFGAAIASGSRTALFYAFAFASLLMCVAAVVVSKWGIDAEGKSLEEVARPLSMVDQPEEEEVVAAEKNTVSAST